MSTYIDLWLKQHPGKGIAWLQMVLRDGFTLVQRTSGEAVILVYEADSGHVPMSSQQEDPRTWDTNKAPPGLGARAYELRKEGKTWDDVGRELGRDWNRGLTLAKSYARSHGLEWPVNAENRRE